MFIKRSKKDIGFYINIFFLVVFVLFLLYLALSHLHSLGTDDLGYFDLDIFYQSISPYLFVISMVYGSFMLGLMHAPVYCEKCKKNIKETLIFRILPGLHYISKTHPVRTLAAILYFVFFLYYFAANMGFLEEVSNEYWLLIIPIGILLVVISFSFMVGSIFRLVHQCRKCDSYIQSGF